jgi:hypothetical protein
MDPIRSCGAVSTWAAILLMKNESGSIPEKNSCESFRTNYDHIMIGKGSSTSSKVILKHTVLTFNKNKSFEIFVDYFTYEVLSDRKVQDL